jgi:hypothetical protein
MHQSGEISGWGDRGQDAHDRDHPNRDLCASGAYLRPTSDGCGPSSNCAIPRVPGASVVPGSYSGRDARGFVSFVIRVNGALLTVVIRADKRRTHEQNGPHEQCGGQYRTYLYAYFCAPLIFVVRFASDARLDPPFLSN